MNDSIEKEFNSIYDETYNKILRYVISKCDNINNVSDIVQNIYLKLYRLMINKKEIINYNALLIKLAKNELFKYYTFKNKFKFIFNINDDEKSDIIDNIKDDGVDLIEEIIKLSDIDSIFDIVKKMDIINQKIITLYYLEDMKINEIAKLLELNESTVKSRLYRAVSEIKTKLGGNYE